MTMGHHQHTATILPFPGRAQSMGKGAGLTAGPAGRLGGEIKPQRTAQPCFTDSWYHQAAIDEATPARKP